MDYEDLSEKKLLEQIGVIKSHEDKEKFVRVLIRKVLWQDIIANNVEHRMTAINVCRYQDGLGLREAADRVNVEIYRNKQQSKQ